MTNILLAEDEEMLAQAITYAMEREGMKVSCAIDGEEAIRISEDKRFDLIILDITMPKVNGLDVARHIRERQDTPILILTALSGEENLLAGFEMGADDYLTKPFSYKELLARTKALLRRWGNERKQKKSNKIVTIGQLEINTESYTARIAGNSLPLTLTEFKILTYLVTNAGRACQGKEILETIQGYKIKEIEAREILRVHIQHIRRKMKTKQGDIEHIENVYGVGYIVRTEKR